MLALFAIELGRPPATDTQTPYVLTQRGATMQRVEGLPSSVNASWWQYRLYTANSPAVGGPYWGIVEGPSFQDAQTEIVRMRRQQTTWWGWLGRIGRPEPMAFTAFNALGPIALLDDAAWSNAWVGLGPGAAREIAARKRRLEVARPLEDALYRLFDDRTWMATFEQDPFRNQGLNIYQAPWLAIAMTRLRVFETEMRSASPIAIGAANADLQAFRSIAKHLGDATDDLAKQKPAPGVLSSVMTDADALSILNGKFNNFTVRAGEGGAGSAEGTITFKFSESGFELGAAPAGWYGGMEPVSFVSIDPLTVRYDPLFGGADRGGIVFLPKDKLRSGYRGPAGLLLPLGTSPQDAETLAEAFRRLVRVSNGIPVVQPPKAGSQAIVLDAPTQALVTRLRDIADQLASLGNMVFRVEEIGARVPAPLAAAIARRDRLWRDSELNAAIKPQCAPGARFVLNGAPVAMSAVTACLAIPMTLVPLDPPTWRVEVYHDRGGESVAVVRQACTAKVIKTGHIVTVSRLVEETWANAASNPRLLGMRVLGAKQVDAAAPSTATALARRFFNLGSRYLDRNRLPEAERSLRRAVSMRPDWATAWNWLAVAVVRQGRVGDAAPLCEQSTLLNPKYVLALTNLADIRRVQGRLADSLSLAKRAAALSPGDAWPHIVLGHAFFANGDFKNAEVEYRAALKVEPGNGTTHADLAGALLREDKKPEATAEASQAISLGERNHWVFKELAIPKS